ncbi:MAG: anthranilate phosphoribosyltransferase [bacterium]|nr:anthranilate phosphoribosyltransferase [bacterium]
MTPKEALAAVVARRDLAGDELASAFEAVLAGGATPAQVGALLVGLRLKGETPEELAAAARVLRRHVVPLPDAPAGAVDTCGTGGDGVHTFNISTAAALVVAACGVPVAKHGNRAVSGSVGSADVLERLGVRLELPPAALVACLRETGIAFLFAPAFHPALRQLAAVRRELGVRTFLNLLGPLVNPAGVRRQVVGVAEAGLVEPIARVLLALGAERAWVVHGSGGLDEIALCGPTEVAEVAGGVVRRFTVAPADAGLAPAPIDALVVDGTVASAACIRAVLDGTPGPARDVVCLNAGAVLVVAGVAWDLAAGVARAAAAIDAGAARQLLARLVAFTAGAAEGAA